MSDPGPVLNFNDSSCEAKEGDCHLRYFSPKDLESLGNFQGHENDFLEFKSHGEYSYLKGQALDIGEMGLTDRQIVAVSLVFFGGLKKNMAAKVMNISRKALRAHIQAGLQKISKVLK